LVDLHFRFPLDRANQGDFPGPRSIRSGYGHNVTGDARQPWQLSVNSHALSDIIGW
jgi:hypothetical protein